MSKAKTDADAIAAVKRALQQYAEQVAPTAAAAEQEMSAITEEVDRFVAQSQREIRGLEAAIEAIEAEEEPNERLLAEKRRQLRIWIRKLDDTRRLQTQLVRAHDDFRGHQRRYAHAMEPLAQQGDQRMRKAREDVIRYEKNQRVASRSATRSWRPIGGSGASSGGGFAGGSSFGGVSTVGSSNQSAGGMGGGGGGTTDGVDASSAQGGVHDPSTGRFATGDEIVVDGLPAGMSLVPLNRCVDEGRVDSPADFDSGKGTATELNWAVQALYRDVLPRMARGGDVGQRLRDTDSGRGLSGTQSLHATYAGFFGESSAIKLSELPDGSYEVNNGAHRIWVARQAGATHMPAIVRRMSQ